MRETIRSVSYTHLDVYKRQAFCLESRHLGLVTPQEICHLKEQMTKAGNIVTETVDLDRLYQIAQGEQKANSPEKGQIKQNMRNGQSREPFQCDMEKYKSSDDGKVRVGVAKDLSLIHIYGKASWRKKDMKSGLF